MFTNEKATKNQQTKVNKEDDLFLSSQIGGWVYILKSRVDNKLYTGSTNNLRKRFLEHNSGKVFSTRLRRPFDVVYYEAYRSEIDARKRETNLKLRSRALVQLKKRIQQSIK